MKNYGKVMNYNGVFGSIKGIDGINYTLLDKNLLDKDLNIFDNVEFEIENIKTPEVDVNMAYFVKVLKKENKRKL